MISCWCHLKRNSYICVSRYTTETGLHLGQDERSRSIAGQKQKTNFEGCTNQAAIEIFIPDCKRAPILLSDSHISTKVLESQSYIKTNV